MKLTLKLTLLLALVLGAHAQALTKPVKSRLDGTKGSVTLQATAVIDKAGHWQTKLYISSPNTPSFMVRLIYNDGATQRTILKTTTAEYGAGNLPSVVILEVPLEVAESGNICVYELMPVSVIGFDPQ